MDTKIAIYMFHFFCIMTEKIAELVGDCKPLSIGMLAGINGNNYLAILPNNCAKDVSV